MKKIALFLLVFLYNYISAQQVPPAKINYQAVARNLNGQPVTGVLGVLVEIHRGTSTGPVVFSEAHSVLTNPSGIFNIVIGSVNTATFSQFNWAAGPHFLEVSVDPNGGINYSSISNQELVSVPYALYAKEAGNAKEYVAGTNVTINSPSSGNTYTINASGSASSNATITILPSSHQVSSVGNAHQLTIASPSFASNSDAVTMSGAFPNYTVNYQNPNLSITGGSVIAITQGTYTSPAVILNNVGSGPWSTSVTNAYLSTGLNNVGIGTAAPVAKLEVRADVASSNNALAAYAQQGNGLLALTNSTNSSNRAVSATNSGTGDGVYGSAMATSTSIAGVRGQNTGAGSGIVGENLQANASTGAHGVRGEANGISVQAAGVYGNNWGSGAGVQGVNTSAATSTGAHGVWGKTSNVNSIASGVLGENYGAGPGVYGYQGSGGASANAHGVYGVTNSSSAAGVYGTNSNSFGGPAVFGQIVSNPSSSNSHGVKGETNSTNGSVGGVFGENKNSGAGVIGINSYTPGIATAHGVKGVTNNSSNLAAGVMGENLAVGPSVLGVKGTTAPFGHAGKFEILATNSLAEALVVNHAGGGVGLSVTSTTNYGLKSQNNSSIYPAIFANNSGSNLSLYAEKAGAQTGEVARIINLNSSNSNPAMVVTNAGSGAALSVNAMTTSTVALQISDGHVKSIGASPTIGSVTVIGVTPLPTANATINNATDVKGIVAITYNGAITGISNGAYFEVPVFFNKPYTTGSTPVVILTPTTDLQGLDYRIFATSNVGFSIRVYKTNNPTYAVPSSIPNSATFTFNYMVIE